MNPPEFFDLPDVSRLKSIPAYLLHAMDGRQLPFLISLLMYDQKGQPVLLPAVVNAINRTIDITGRIGLVTHIVRDGESVEQVVQRSVFQVLAITDAILLYHCQSSEIAEALIGQLMDAYQITLIRGSTVGSRTGAPTLGSGG